MVLHKLAEGKMVYRRLGYEGATRLMDTVADHIGSALLQCIAEAGNGKSASTSASAPSPAPVPASLSPPTVAELPVSAVVSRNLVFDRASIDKAGGAAALIRVYLDGYLGFFPFIKYFPVQPCGPLPAQFSPDQEQQPRWEGSHRDQWDKRNDLAFEVCRQAYALQQAVNARVPGFEAHRNKETRKSKKKFHGHDVSMDLRTAASKAAGLLQAAIQANKKSGCHPQSVGTFSKMFKELRAGKEDAEVHRSKNDPKAPAPAG